ncbi:hypothetical protein Csa_013460 [Cucumis sativus]|uniref:Uncharacterized protein n=1 Tax=Cucumis sativus TaxID=3659 RepID=A0A0A0LR19_CUCSA|nr:hypothetical protein Csa_013460 [Cucumis sativus]
MGTVKGRPNRSTNGGHGLAERLGFNGDAARTLPDGDIRLQLRGSGGERWTASERMADGDGG